MTMRKNLLLGTSALVAGGLMAADYAVAEEPLRLDVRGYRNEYFGIGNIDHDTVDFNNTGHFSDGEVQFRGETTLDNGITVGVQVELEAFTSGDQIDENYAFIHGSFGRLVLGSENSAPYQGFWSVTAPSVGVPLNSGWITSFIPAAPGSTTGFRTPALTTNLDLHNDDNVISYYTPRFNGFQLSATYIPTLANTGDGANFPVQANTDSQRHNGFAVGLHYTQSFNALDFTWAGAFNYVGDCDGAVCAGGGTDPIWQAKSGINFGYAGSRWVAPSATKTATGRKRVGRLTAASLTRPGRGASASPASSPRSRVRPAVATTSSSRRPPRSATRLARASACPAACCMPIGMTRLAETPPASCSSPVSASATNATYRPFGGAR